MGGLKRIIAAVRGVDEFQKALTSNVETIFFLNPDIKILASKADAAHINNKRIFIHMDLVTGLGKDKSGIEFAKSCGIDGIISTRTNIIKFARECGLKTVQRFFVVDSHSIDTSIEAIKAAKPDMIEIMPGIATKAIEKFKAKIDIPLIAGGLIETKAEAALAIKSGAAVISTGCVDLWNI